MKVIEHYKRASEPLISFEIIPPKRGGSIDDVFNTLDPLMRFSPPFIDVTYHAAEAYYEELTDGSIKRHILRKRPGTIGLCAAIKHRYNVDPVPHLLCKGFTKDETEDALIELNYLGIDNILAVRGDESESTRKPGSNLEANEYAVDLVKQISNMNRGKYLNNILDPTPSDFCIGVAGYPEKHFEAPNMEWDLKRLKEKVDAGADYIVTQMFFDNHAFFEFERHCREFGIDVPIIPGLKVLTRFDHLKSLPSYFHLSIPSQLVEEISARPEQTRQIGIEWAKKQSLELLDHGVQGLHYYVMGNPTPAIEVIDSLPITKRTEASS